MKHFIIVAICLITLNACETKPQGTPSESTAEGQTVTEAKEDAVATISSGTGTGTMSGVTTLSELFANSKKYEGQLVKVQGKVVKLNNMIMKRNWIHIQDSSVPDGKTDLTITTLDNVALGDVVSFEGKIALNKDFGAGYIYEIIMEEAHIIR